MDKAQYLLHLPKSIALPALLERGDDAKRERTEGMSASSGRRDISVDSASPVRLLPIIANLALEKLMGDGGNIY